MTPLLTASGIGMDNRLRPADLLAHANTLTAIVGPNGGGKTSLLRSLARIDDPLGRVWIAGEDVDQAPPVRRRSLLSFLPAAREVTWPISVRDVISLGLSRDEPSRVEELIASLELEKLAGRPVNQLSTGERARVLLARALAPRPMVLLLDEPLSNLDPYWALRILEVVTASARGGAAVLVTLHDLNLLDRFDRTIAIAEGALVADESPSAFLSGGSISAIFGVQRAPSSGWQIA